MDSSTVMTNDAFACLLELAANNDVDGFKGLADQNPSSVDEVGMWYGRRKGSKQMVLEKRTPLMVAATYGSVDVVKLILSLFEVNVNRSCGQDKSTALHCAASGGSTNAVEIVEMLLAAGANPNLTDASGHRPGEVLFVSPKHEEMKPALERLLNTDASNGDNILRVSTANSTSYSPPLSPSPVNGSPSSGSDSTTSPKINDLPVSSATERREYPVDPSLPDIKNSMYSTDEFRMFQFKIRPCSRAYSHDWTECPFVHPGENARRRDPRKYHYSCVPCPEFRKGACRRGDLCEYAHGVFECWLHPAQYRTRICKDGISCNRRVCFFAHTQEELRPLYVSTGSAVPSPRSAPMANPIDYAAAMNLLPGSPSSVQIMSPSPYSPPMSPSASNMSNFGWNQPNVPTLHLPGSSLHSSRLRSSLNARDIRNVDFGLSPDMDIKSQQFDDDMSRLGQPNMNSLSLNVSARSNGLSPSNLEDFFAVESSSPRYSDHAVFTPGHKPTSINPFQQQQSVLSPIKTGFTPKNYDHSLLQASFGVPSPGRMSPRTMEPISPMGSRVSMLAQREKQQQQLRSLSSRDLGSSSTSLLGSPRESWPNWGSSSQMPEWAGTSEFGKMKRTSSFEIGNNGEEPDLSWVQKLVKEGAYDMNDDDVRRPSTTGLSAYRGEGTSLNHSDDPLDPATLSALLDQMQKLDHLSFQYE